jgi:hypothetical protein
MRHRGAILPSRNNALDFARRAVLATFSTDAEPVVWPYDEDVLWCEDRHPVTDERRCDYEDNGIMAWRIF